MLIPHQVFISYAKEDITAAMGFYRSLKQEGIRAWIDVEALEPGENWELGIKKALRSCRYVLLLISSRSQNKRGYIQKEIREALDIAETFPEEQIFIVPAKIEDCQIPERLAKWQVTDVYHDEGKRKILNFLKTKLGISNFPLLKAQEQELRSILSPDLVTDTLLFRKYSFATSVMRSKEQSKSLYISDGSSMEVRKRNLKFIRTFDEIFPVCEKVPADRFVNLIDKHSQSFKEKNTVEVVKFNPDPSVWHSRACELCTSSGLTAVVNNDYLNYIRVKYPAGKIYLIDEMSPVVVVEDGTMRFMVMPMRR